MTQSEETFDVILIGGGLAGLSLAILCARAGWRTLVCEQKAYPFHRVCGEYVAMESWGFLQGLGLDLASQHLPQIRRLLVTTPSQSLSAPLQPSNSHPNSRRRKHGVADTSRIGGGFGISRYALDAQLADRARALGVILRENTRVKQVTETEHGVEVHTHQGVFRAPLAGGAFGKWSNLDRALRPQQLPAQTGAETYVGIKYHLRTRFPRDLIALHNFKGGYCGISAIEQEETVCCCYLVSQEHFSAAGSVERLQEETLSQNPYLRSIFEHSEPCWAAPLAIAQVYFSPRQWPSEHRPKDCTRLFMLGDAAGMIPPLSGNGMSMALRSSALLFEVWQQYFTEHTPLPMLQRQYRQQWQQAFGLRLRTGSLLQQTFGHLGPINALLYGLRPFPGLAQALIARTHGTAFSVPPC